MATGPGKGGKLLQWLQGPDNSYSFSKSAALVGCASLLMLLLHCLSFTYLPWASSSPTVTQEGAPLNSLQVYLDRLCFTDVSSGGAGSAETICSSARGFPAVLQSLKKEFHTEATLLTALSFRDVSSVFHQLTLVTTYLSAFSVVAYSISLGFAITPSTGREAAFLLLFGNCISAVTLLVWQLQKPRLAYLSLGNPAVLGHASAVLALFACCLLVFLLLAGVACSPALAVCWHRMKRQQQRQRRASRGGARKGSTGRQGQGMGMGSSSGPGPAGVAAAAGARAARDRGRDKGDRVVQKQKAS